jgi:hypothetical protein
VPAVYYCEEGDGVFFGVVEDELIEIAYVVRWADKIEQSKAARTQVMEWAEGSGVACV